MPDYIAPPTTLPPGSMVWGYLRDSGGEAAKIAPRNDISSMRQLLRMLLTSTTFTPISGFFRSL